MRVILNFEWDDPQNRTHLALEITLTPTLSHAYMGEGDRATKSNPM